MDECLIEEAAGSTCCFIVNVLHKVKLQVYTTNTTTKNNNSNLLQLVGLKDPGAFQRLVMAMKAQQQQAVALQRNTVLVHNNNNSSRREGIGGVDGPVTTDCNLAEVQTLLHDVRNELREHSQLYQSARGQPIRVEPKHSATDSSGCRTIRGVPQCLCDDHAGQLRQHSHGM